MANTRDFLDLVGFVYASSAVISVSLNGLSIFIALKKSPKALGAYRHLMVVISVYEIFYALLCAFLVPIHYAHGSAIIQLVRVSDKPVGRTAIVCLNLLYWFMYGASLTIMSLHFIYRWLVISKHALLSSFHSWKFVLWLTLPFSMGLVWMIDGYFLCSPSRETSDYMRSGISETLGRSLDEFEYLGVQLFEREENGEVRLHYRSLSGLAIMELAIISTFSVIIYFGVRCYREMTDIMNSSSSSRFRNLHSQLFYSLVAQTLVPIFLVHLPTTFMIIAILVRFDLGINCLVVSMCNTLYPSLEPLPNLFIIKPYRVAIYEFFKCRRTTVHREEKSAMTIELFHRNSYLIRIHL